MATGVRDSGVGAAAAAATGPVGAVGDSVVDAAGAIRRPVTATTPLARAKAGVAGPGEAASPETGAVAGDSAGRSAGAGEVSTVRDAGVGAASVRTAAGAAGSAALAPGSCGA